MMSRRLQNRDPKLEGLRAVGLAEGAPPFITPLVQDLAERTRRIHAGFLFHSNGSGQCDAWHVIMTRLCATALATNNRTSDWKAFANHLGFSKFLIQSIENVQPGSEDPVTNTLRAFAQLPHATLDKVVLALADMGREDILLTIHEPLSELANGVVHDYEERMMADDMSVGSDSGYLSRDSSSGELPAELIIKPDWIPKAPCLLKHPSQLSTALERIETSQIFGPDSTTTSLPSATPLPQSNIPESTVVRLCPLSPNLAPALQQSEPVRATPPEESQERDSDSSRRPEEDVNEEERISGTRKKYACTVLLTFAEDGRAFARELAATLRRPSNTEERVGVVILEEQQHMLNQDPVAFVTGCFEQVDYVVPVLTPAYLNSLQADAPSRRSGSDCVDANHTRFIYRLMLDEFIRSNCLNRRVRSMIPDALLKQVHRDMATVPIFQAFHCLSAAEKFTLKLLQRRI